MAVDTPIPRGPETGATAEQIERAAKDQYESGERFYKRVVPESVELGWGDLTNDQRDFQCFDMGLKARWLVQPNERIIALDDLKRLRDFMNQAYSNGEIRMCGPFLKTIDALIAGDPR